jgi:hypothetical protein
LKEKQINEIVLSISTNLTQSKGSGVPGVLHFFCCSEGALSVLLDKAPVMMRTVTKERTLYEEKTYGSIRF